MTKNIKNKKKWWIFCWILIGSIIITISPAFFLRDKIVFDPAQFVNQWIELFGGGIIIALMFYGVTQRITHIENKYEDKKYIRQIIHDLTLIKETLENKQIENKADALIRIKMMSLNTEMINNKKIKLLLYKELNIYYVKIRSELIHLDKQTNDTREIVTIIDLFIKNIESWEMK